MIRHLLRLSWNRRGSYALLGAELLVAFLLATVVLTEGMYSLSNHLRPLGFDYRDVWWVKMESEGEFRFAPGEWAEKDSVAVEQVYRALAEFDETESVAADNTPPFTWYWEAYTDINGQMVDYYYSKVSDKLDEVLRLDMVAGRWFGPEDDAFQEQPVVINQYLARYLFGDQDPVGKMLISEKGQWKARVIGVVSDHRNPLMGPCNFMFHRVRLDRLIRSEYLPRSFLLRVPPGTPQSLERQIVDKLQAAAQGWVVDFNTLEEQRADGLRWTLRHLLIKLLISGSLLLMVALGLVGVLWQNVTRRTREIGIRRAAGATKGRICMQFVGEILVLTSVAVIVGAVLVANSSVLDLFPGVSSGVYLAGFLAAAGGLYLLVVAAALYPGWLATRVQPAQALHHE